MIRAFRKQQHGFTLIELSVAITIFSIGVLAFYGAFARAATSREYAAQRMERLAAARSALDLLESDLAGAGPTGYTKTDLPMLLSPDPERSDPFAPARILLDLTTYSSRGVAAPEAGWSFDAGPPDRGDQARVAWVLTAEGRLLRRELRPPALVEDPTEFLENDEQSVNVIENVNELRFRFFDGEEWLTFWESAESTKTASKLPIMVETSLVMIPQDEDSTPMHLVSTVFLPLAEPLQ